MTNPESVQGKVEKVAITLEEIMQFRIAVSEAALTRVFNRSLPDWTDSINSFVMESGVVKAEDSPRLFLQRLPLWHAFAGSTLNPDTTFAPLTEAELAVAEEVEKMIATFVEKFKAENGL